MQEYSDEQLVEEYLNGDEKSLEVLIKKYLKPVFGFAYGFVNNMAEAEDITQEVFVKIWKNIKKFDKKKNFKIWIFSIAKNTAIDFLRKKKPVLFSEFENDAGKNLFIDKLVDPAPLPSEIFDRIGLEKMVSESLTKIPPKFRQVLLMHYNMQFNFREIAEILEESENTVRSRHRRALIMLRQVVIRPENG